ncbi:hypothetical protein [Sphingomonas oligophenolica]|nr:hypothetical protein [Sphingomonas oligophenolica]
MTNISTENGDDLHKCSFDFPKQRKEPLEVRRTERDLEVQPGEERQR